MNTALRCSEFGRPRRVRSDVPVYVRSVAGGNDQGSDTASRAHDPHPPAPARPSDRSARHVWLRRIGVAAVAAVLVGAIVVRRGTIADAIAEIGRLPLVVVAALTVLAGYERWSRADITARLLGPLRTRDGLGVHDVGNAASKGVPMGGALGTALRWSVVRDHGVSPVRFSTMLVAYGIATGFVTWILPLLALLVDAIGRPMTATDGILILVLTLGIVGHAVFW